MNADRKAFRAKIRRLLLAVLLATAPAAAAAQDSEAVQSARRLEELERSLQSSLEKQQELESAAADVAKAEAELSDRMISATAEIQAAESFLSEAEARIAQLKSEAAGIRKQLLAKRDVLEQVLAGLQKLEQNPPPALVVAPEDIVSALRGAMVFGAVVPGMKSEAAQLAKQVQKLGEIETELAGKAKETGERVAVLQAGRTELEQLMAEKRQLAMALSGDLAAEEGRITELASQAKSLQQLVARLAAEQAQEEARKSAERRARDEALDKHRLALMKPKVPLSRAKGRLDYPVQGTILAQFGDKSAETERLAGQIIATRPLAQVKAPVGGKVAFAGPFRSYGHVVIVDAGEDYLILLAGMVHVSAAVGQAIAAGEPVGEMGEKPNLGRGIAGHVNRQKPMLYVEFRKQGKPVDPALWWVGGRKEAMR